MAPSRLGDPAGSTTGWTTTRTSEVVFLAGNYGEAMLAAAGLRLCRAGSGPSRGRIGERGERVVVDVSTGTVKWFDPGRGFGRVVDDAGGEVHVHVSALPDGVTTLAQGTRVAFDVRPGKPGSLLLRARAVQVLTPTVGTLRTTAQVAAVVEQAITLLDGVSTHLRHGRHPDRGTARTTAAVLRAAADALHP
jgi:CspA family cold shock protein